MKFNPWKSLAEYRLKLLINKNARIQELGEEIRQAYYEGWGDAIRETGEEFYSTDMENNWLESETAKALKEGED